MELEEPDTRLETLFLDTFALVYGTSFLQGGAVANVETLNELALVNTFDLFNKNVIYIYESHLINSPSRREFFFNLYTKFMTLLKLRHPEITLEDLIDKFSHVTIEDIQPVTLKSEQYQRDIRFKTLKQSIVPLDELKPMVYLRKNPWYLMVVFINIFSMELFQVIEDIKSVDDTNPQE